METNILNSMEHPLGDRSEFAEGSRRLVEKEGKIIAIFCHEGKLFALEDRCPHRAGPLSEGIIQNGRIQCPWHQAEFELETGAVCSGPVRRAIAKHEIFERDGIVFLKVNKAAPT